MQPPVPQTSITQSVARSSNEEMQVLLFKLGDRTLGVPLQQVRYVAAMPPDFASHGAETRDHFVFEGDILTYVSLWDHLKLHSDYAEYEEMQAMLPQRKQDHVDWMDALRHSIETGSPFSKARDPHECAFGKWYYGYHARDRRLSLLFNQFEHPHATIHALADRLLGMVEAGQQEAALHAFEEAKNTTLATLFSLFASAQDLVVELQRRIAVIMVDGEDTCALGADGVSDIVTVSAAQIKPSRGGASGTDSKVASALLILEDESVVPLLNWRLFSAGAA